MLSRADLFDGIAERLFGAVVLPPPAGTTWHQQLSAVLDSLRTALRAHPAVAGLAIPRIVCSDAGLVIADRVLALLRQARFSPEQAAEVGSYVLYAIVTLVASELRSERMHDAEERHAAVRERLAKLHALSAKRYPNVVASADAIAQRAGNDLYFARGVDLLVEGIRGIQPGRPNRTAEHRAVVDGRTARPRDCGMEDAATARGCFSACRGCPASRA